MAFKLTKEEEVDRKRLADNVKEAAELFGAAVDEANQAISDALDLVERGREGYAKAISEAQDFADNVGARLREEFDEKSETWQNGEAGTAAEEVVSSWESLSLEEPDEIEEFKLAEPTVIEDPFEDVVDAE
jgi:hypothetical protein